MRKYYEILKRFPVLIFALITLVFFMPNNLAKPLETARNAVVTSIGIDLKDNEYEVTYLAFIPTPAKDFIETYNISSVKAETLSQAMTQAGLHFGKDVTLFHTEVAVLGNGIIESNLSKTLDYLSREESLSSSCILVATNKSAKEMLKFMQQEDINPSEKLREIMLYNFQKVSCQTSSVESFYEGFYSPEKCSFMPLVTLNDKKEDTGIMLNNTSSNSGSEQGKEKAQKEIQSDGSVVVFKNGKKVDVFDSKILSGMNWINPNKAEQDIVIERYNDEMLKNAKVVYHTNKKQITKSTNFENNIPIFSVSIKVFVDRVEVYGDRDVLNESIQLNQINNETKRLIETKIKKEFADSLSYLRKNKTDLIGVYYQFYQKNRGNFKNFLKSLEDREDFLNFVVFKLNITVEAD